MPSVMWAMRIGACRSGGAMSATTKPAAKARITASALVQWMSDGDAAVAVGCS